MREIEGRQVWTDDADRELRKRWSKGESLNKIATALKRQPGLVLGRAHALRVTRWDTDNKEFDSCVMSWRIRRLRAELIEAERRGLNLLDDGSGLMWHRALLRRFHAARMLIATPPEDDVPSWLAVEQRALRKYRDRMLSVRRAAWLLERNANDVARRLVIEGRFVNGHWTDLEDKTIARGLRLGFSIGKIATRLKHRYAHDVQARITQLFPKNRKGYVLWSRAEVQRVIDLHLAGYRGQALTSRMLSRGHHAVRRLLYGILKEPREGKEWEAADINILTRAMVRKESLQDISKWLGRDIESIRPIFEFKFRRRGGRAVTVSPEIALDALNLLKVSTRTQSEVAAQFGVSRPALYRAIKRLKDEKAMNDGR